MTPAERYLLLGLRLDRHVEGIVDSYYGPAELKTEAESGDPVAPSQLAADGAALLAELEDGWLRDLVLGLETYARVLAGEPISYSDEVERCYGVRPARIDRSVYEQVHEELDRLLPGEGSLADRREAWREQNRVDPQRLMPAMRDVLAEARRRTRELFGLPDGEELLLEEVHDEPWWAFNYYQGDLVSRVVLNIDVPTTGFDLIHLAAHEVYPGHHTEHSLKEQLLLRDAGALEEAIQLVPTPQALVSEGIAEVGLDVVLDADARAEAYVVLARHGIEFDVDLTERIAKVSEKLGTAGDDAALLIHADGASEEDAKRHIERWGLATPERAARGVRFVTDPTWRAYAITYTAGERLCRGFVDGDPARFRQLLTEHVRVSELQSG